MPPIASHALQTHGPLLANLLGHAAGALLFGIFLTLAFRDRAGRQVPGYRLSLSAAACALFWNLASLAVLAAPVPDAGWVEGVLAAGASALSLLPALLFDLSLGARLRRLVQAGYVLSACAIGLHLAEPWLAGPRTHSTALLLTAAGYSALTAWATLLLWRGPQRGRRRLSRIAGAMPLVLLALSFVHFRATGAHSAWPAEMLIHHAGIPLALFILLRDYRFILLDAFLRFLANFLLAALFALAAYRLHRALEPAPVPPAVDALELVLYAIWLIVFAIARAALRRLLTRLWFRPGDPQLLLARLAAAGGHDHPDAYLEVEQLRLGAKLRVEIDIAPETNRAAIPVLSIQPLVENAVRHGIAPLAAGGTLRIRAVRSDGALEVEVFDTGGAYAPGPKSEGVGLENVRRRLRLVCGPAADLTIEAAPAGTRVLFRVPFPAAG